MISAAAAAPTKLGEISRSNKMGSKGRKNIPAKWCPLIAGKEKKRCWEADPVQWWHCRSYYRTFAYLNEQSAWEGEREQKEIKPMDCHQFFSVVGWQAVKDNSSVALICCCYVKSSKIKKGWKQWGYRKRGRRKNHRQADSKPTHTHFEMEKACTKSVLSTFSKLKASSQKLKTRASALNPKCTGFNQRQNFSVAQLVFCCCSTWTAPKLLYYCVLYRFRQKGKKEGWQQQQQQQQRPKHKRWRFQLNFN